VNGSAGHALDYDDVLRAFRGHPTAPVAPAILALAERDLKSGADVLAAFIAGVETEARVGMLMGDSHYLNGWHATGTNGAFGAAAASAWMLGLDADAMATALGIAGTQAAGLKSMFGTMCKPFHAGKAAMNGLMAAELAARGFTSRDDVLECPQGYAATQTETFDPEAALDRLGELFWMPNLLFKYHAACYGTHAGIESVRAIRVNPAFDPDKIERVDLHVPPRTMNMCNIPEPTTGLEIKFSHRFTSALALAGEETGSLEVYSEDMAKRADLVALRDKIRVTADEKLGPSQTSVTVHQSDGTVIRERRDMAIPSDDIEGQWEKLETKFRALAAPLVGEKNTDRAVEMVAGLEGQEDIAALMAAVAGR
jgi:2-methylcitrate dehydratase PrpD